MRRAAERNVRPDMTSPSLVVDHFTRFPPMTNTGSLRFAEALSAVGRRADAIFHARAAWVGGTLAPDDETRPLELFAPDHAPPHTDSRMERTVWADAA